MAKINEIDIGLKTNGVNLNSTLLNDVYSAVYKKGYSPYIDGDTGTWFEYDETLGEFVDTGVIAEARDYTITDSDKRSIADSIFNDYGLNNTLSTQNSKINTINSRLDDARSPAEGFNNNQQYSTIGDAIRGQVNEVNNTLNDFIDEQTETNQFVSNHLLHSNTTLTGTDLNTLLPNNKNVNGRVYWCMNDCTNTPVSSSYGMLECFGGIQRFTLYPSGESFSRIYTNTQWYPWSKQRQKWINISSNCTYPDGLWQTNPAVLTDGHITCVRFVNRFAVTENGVTVLLTLPSYMEPATTAYGIVYNGSETALVRCNVVEKQIVFNNSQYVEEGKYMIGDFFIMIN